MKAYITVGLPASGKSTWAQEFAAQNDCVIINNDTIRNEIYEKLGHRNWSKEIEKMVKFIRESQIISAKSKNKNVIVDNTHMNPWTREQIIDFCKQNGFDVELVDFTHVPLEECIRRDSLREGYERVGEKVIMKMWNMYKTKKAIRYLPDLQETGKPKCIIVDIDGTLAWNNTGRSFYGSNVHEDAVRVFVRDTVEALAKTEKIRKVFIFSGREGKAETIKNTQLWFDTVCKFPYDILHKFEIILRKEGDFRPDSETKMEMYETYVKDKYDVFAVFDDRAQVIRECWKKLNLPVFRCGVIDEDES
jgi:predicted kinase